MIRELLVVVNELSALVISRLDLQDVDVEYTGGVLNNISRFAAANIVMSKALLLLAVKLLLGVL